MGSPTHSKKDEWEDTCVICLSPVTEKAITVPCNHYTFDFVCLASWLQERSTCPLCKTRVTAVQYDWRSPTEHKTFPVPQTHVPIYTQPSNIYHRRVSLLAPYGLPERPRGIRRPYSPPAEGATLHRRREVYRRKLYSLHVGSNPYSGYRDITPQIVVASPELQSRARSWIRRELRVFSFLYADAEASSSGGAMTSSNAEFLLSYIVSILKMADVKASDGHAENLLSEFLGRDNARLFLHELNSWLRSPYKKVQEWDEHVQYKMDLDDNSR